MTPAPKWCRVLQVSEDRRFVGVVPLPTDAEPPAPVPFTDVARTLERAFHPSTFPGRRLFVRVRPDGAPSSGDWLEVEYVSGEKLYGYGRGEWCAVGPAAARTEEVPHAS